MTGKTGILDRAQACIDLFHNVLSATRAGEKIDSSAELSAHLDDELGRFNIWAGNIGVFAAHENATLDYRVRDVPQIRDLIVQQLDGLVKCLKHAIEITRQEAWRTSPQLANAPDQEGGGAEPSIPSVSDSSSSSDLSVTQSEPSSQSPLKKGIEDIEKTITRLYRLSVAIRKSATNNRKTKAASYVDRDENGHDMSSEFENFAIRLIRLKYPDMSQALRKRLGYANSLRRRQFLYRQRHQQKLSLGSNNRVRDKVVESKPEIEPSLWIPQNRTDDQSIIKDIRSGRSPALRQDGKSALLSQTMATALEIRSFRPGDALSKVSTAITAAPMQASFDVPPPPRMSPRAKELQCPYCCLILPVKIASAPRWRHHVKKDLEPYVCLFEECTEPHSLFATTEAWLSHMQREHTINWCCNAPGHPPQSFGKEQDFDNHMRSSHAGTFTESQLPLLKRRSAQPAPVTFISCPLCGYLPAESPNGQNSAECLEDLPNHIAAHLQSIAVMSLPWREDLEEVASSNRTSAPRPSDSIPDLDESSRIIVDDMYVVNEGTGIEQDRASRDDEWGFIEPPSYEGHTTDPVLRAFISKSTLTTRVAASALMQDLLYSVEATSKHFRNLLPRPSICEKLYRELLRVPSTLRNLQARLETTQPDDPWFKVFVEKAKPGGTLLADGSFQLNGTVGTDGPLMQLGTCLEEIQDAFVSHLGLQASHLNRQFLPQDNPETLLYELYGINEQILSILDGDHFDVLDNGPSTADKRLWKGFRSLSTLNFAARQKQIFQDSYVSPRWLLESQEFKAWTSGRPWILYVYGNPGVGKTVLSSMVIRDLQLKSESQNSVVLCIYLSQKESRTQTLENLFGSLIRQFLEHHYAVFQRSDTAELIYGVKPLIGRTNKEKLVSVLRSDVLKFRRVYIIVDALNEADESIRHELEVQLKSLQSDGVSIMITSRHMGTPPAEVIIVCDACSKRDLRIFYHCQICDNGNFDLCQDCIDQQKSCKDKSHLLLEPYSVVEMDMIITNQDIQGFVELELETSAITELARFCESDPQLKTLVTSTVVQNANGSYLFAKLYMNALKQQQTASEVMELLQRPYSSLAGHFESTMHHINAQKKRFSAIANEILPWIIYACRPLTFEELQQAVAAMSEADLTDPGELLDLECLLSVTAGLVTIDSASVLTLVHPIAHQYFTVHAKKWFPTAEMDIARAIMNYIMYEAISRPCLGYRDDPEFKARRRSHPFLLYAAIHWGDHVRNVIHEPIIHYKVLQFLRSSSNLASCSQAAVWAFSTGPSEWDRLGIPSSIHKCAKFGLTPIIPELLQDGLDVDSQEPAYLFTPLMFACKGGHAESVQELLESGASVNIRSRNTSSAILEAIRGGHLDVVRLLLKRNELDINAMYSGDIYRTALMVAVQSGHEDIVRCLLQRADIDVNASNPEGTTALIFALEQGQSATAFLLLDYKGLDINGLNQYGSSALMLAAEKGFDRIVERLLDMGVDPLIASAESGGTAMERAIMEQHSSVVELMVAHGVDIRFLDNRGRNLLHKCSGPNEIIRLLIANGLDPNSRCNRGGTPLHYATRFIESEVPDTLLTLGADPSVKDNYGRTSLDLAWQYGNLRVARLLGGQHDASAPDSEEVLPIEIAKTLPLWSITLLGRRDLVASMLDSGRDLETYDPLTDRSAIHLAATFGHNEILRLLLDANLSPNCKNDEDRTPLHFAARYGRVEATSILLQYKADPNVVDRWGSLPLSSALVRGYFSTAIPLIDASLISGQEIAMKIPERYLRPLVFSAVEADNAKVVEYLVGIGASIWIYDEDGLNVAQIAEKLGHDHIADILRKRIEFSASQLRPMLDEARTNLSLVP